VWPAIQIAPHVIVKAAYPVKSPEQPFLIAVAPRSIPPIIQLLYFSPNSMVPVLIPVPLPQ
jgi:hypothetical protein